MQNLNHLRANTMNITMDNRNIFNFVESDSQNIETIYKKFKT